MMPVMKRKEKDMKHLIAVLLLALFTASCTQTPLVDTDDNNFTEGEKTTLHIALKNAGMNVMTRTGLSSEEEEEIHSVAIYIIDEAMKQVVSSTFHINVAEHNYPTGDLKVETLVGNNRSIYVIANYDANLIEELKTVASINDAEALVAEFYGNPLQREFGLAKTGKLTGQKIRKNQLITVDLEYITAKVTTSVVNKSAQFTVLGWALGNAPTQTYLFQHDTDALTNEDYYHALDGQMMRFEEVIPNKPEAGNTTYSNTFYLYENRRGGRDLTKTAPPANWPYGETGEVRPTGPGYEYLLKSWYAPQNATYIKIYGKWNDGATKREVTITHYLGENNYDDYNIRRATHYTYKITIESLTNIKVDTNVEMKESNLTVLTPAQLMNLDAHYCYRPFTLNVQEVTDPDAKISIEVLESPNSTVHSHWLDLSATFLFMQHVRDNTAPNPPEGAQLAINTWLQPGNDWNYVRPRFVPNQQDRSAGGIAAGYVPPTGVSFPSTMFPDNDVVMEYKPENYHRMVKKFTGLPTGAPGSPKQTTEPVHIILYAKEYPINDLNHPLSATFREAVVRITLERPGHAPEYKHFTVRQHSPHIFAHMSNGTEENDDDDILLVEREEEYALLLRPYIAMELQVLSGMQWGEWDITSTAATGIAATNGFTPTLLGVYNTSDNQTVTDPNNYTGSNSAYSFRTPMYGSLEGGWDKNNKGRIEQGNAALFSNVLQGQPYFSIPKNDYRNAININYNTTAARYCHEKNWDENGDGVIAGKEVKWYLPSVAEVQLFWTYHEILNLQHEHYWTSNQADPEKAYALSMEHAQAEPDMVYNGVPYPFKKAHSNAQNPPRVRCVRRVPAASLSNNQPMMPLVYHTASSSIVDCSSLPGSITTTQSKLGIAQGNSAAIQKANERVYKKLEVQRTQAGSPVSYAKLHYGNYCDPNQGWRLPTQRELLIIYSMRSKLEANTKFDKFKNGTYWSMTSDLSRQYLVEFGNNGLAIIDNASSNSNAYYYRCVRELN